MKTPLLAVILLMIVSCNRDVVIGPQRSSPEVYPYYNNGKCGLVDEFDSVLVEAKFDFIDPTQSLKKRYWVRVDGLVAEADSSFKIVRKTPFSYILTSDTLTIASLDLDPPDLLGQGKGYWGIADDSNRWILPPTWGYIHSLNGGYFEVMRGSIGSEEGIFGNGGWLLPPEKYSIQRISDDQFSFYHSYMDKYQTVIRRDGRIIELPYVVKIRPYRDGLALVQSVTGRFGAIDEDCRLVVDTVFQVSGEFDDGFSNGLLCVKDEDKWGFIDKTGRLVIPYRFENARRFNSEGLAMVKQNNRWGIIDKSGNFVVEPLIVDFRLNGEGGPLWFSSAEEFLETEETGRVHLWGLMEQTGKIIVAPRFTEVEKLSKSHHTWVRETKGEDSKWGLMNTRGEFLIVPTYDSIDASSRWTRLYNLVEVMNNGERKFCSPNGNPLGEKAMSMIRHWEARYLTPRLVH